jgi:TRAP-type C4-dicarboxylate transport system permease small subunit
MSAQAEGGNGEHLIHVEDDEIVIEHHPEDWLAFAVFWALAAIVFWQFFTRYALNDPATWTEEIARYGLIWITYIGAVMVTRRNSHIAVLLLPNLLPAGGGRLLLAIIDLVTLGFVGLLAYFSVLIVGRMHTQPMSIVDLPMSYVYAAVVLGCILMLARQAQRVWRNARDGWREAHAALTDGLVDEPQTPASKSPAKGPSKSPSKSPPESSKA